jgi:hypothetical protein
MKDVATLHPERIHKRHKRNPHKRTLREALKNEKLSESSEHEDKATDGQNTLTLREALQTIEAWKKKRALSVSFELQMGE